MPTPNLLERIAQPARVVLPITRGDSLFFKITLKDKLAGGSRVPLTGKQGKAQIRRSVDAPIDFDLTVTVDQSAAGGSTTGEITIEAKGDATTLFPETGVWDLQISDGSVDGTFRKTIAQGPIRFTRDVTR